MLFEPNRITQYYIPNNLLKQYLNTRIIFIYAGFCKPNMLKSVKMCKIKIFIYEIDSNCSM